jgi:uncharacterized protein (DUF433 family)
MVVYSLLQYCFLVFAYRLSEVLGMKCLERITFDSQVMGGKPCIRGMRVTVGTLVGLLAVGHSVEEILNAYPYLEKEDITAALSYATWRSEEVEVALVSA